MSGAAPNQGAKPQVHPDSVPSSAKPSHTSTSADNDPTAATEGGNNEEQQEAPGSSGGPTSSPEPNCAICLGQLENKSFTDSCFHMFCFVCLQEWSKVKAECPLCKQPFKSIIHNVKSYNNYDQFYLDHQRPPPQPLHYGWNFDRSFHYRTTLTMDHRYFNIHDFRYLNRGTAPAARDLSEAGIYRRSLIPPRYRLRSRTVHPMMRHHTEIISTSNFRRQIYESGRRVSGLRTTHRRRTVSPEFFRSNPAQTHRLVPWLNRELNALLYSAENQVTFVLELIMDLVKRFPIDSDEFYEHIHPYLRHNTRHFMHEFLYFARSPYTMQTYDTKAIYEEPSHTVSSSGSSSNDNSDVVVVVDDDDDEDEITSPAGLEGRTFDAARPASPWRSSPQAAGTMFSTSTSLLGSRWDSPTPGPSWDLSGNSSQSPVNVDDSSDSDASTIIDPTYAAPETSASQPARLPSPQVSDGEEVIFVSYDKPWEERSPIQLSSGSEDESLSQFIKALKQENKRRKRARSSAGSLETSHQNKRRAYDQSRSSASPVPARERSMSSTSGHDVSSQHDKHHRRRHHHESSEGSHHSPRSGRKEKRKNSHSRSKSSSKKRRHDTTEKDEGWGESDASPKKRKHKKKHRKNKKRSDKHSTRGADGHKTGSLRGPLVSESATSTTTTEKMDNCKKHPSGHKKSRVKGAGDGGEAESKEGSSGHHSDSILSDNSTSSGSGTATTTSLTNTEHSSAKYFSRHQRVQQALQERQRQAFLPMLDLTPSWENITRLASMLASHTSSQLAAMPGPSQSSSDPVVISTSSDESEVEESSNGKYGSDRLTTDSIHVAKTVVVPCSSNPEMPTAAIDLSCTSVSTSSLRPVVEDSYIDVDSISSEEDNSNDEVVNVESLEDTEDNITEPLISSNTRETKISVHASPVTEVSTETKHVFSPSNLDRVKPSVSTSCLPFSIDSILNTDVFMGVDASSQPLSRQTSTTPSLDMPVSSQGLAHSQPQPKRDDEYMNQQAFNFVSLSHQYSSRGMEASSQPLSRQTSTTPSIDMSMSSQDFLAHSQPQPINQQTNNFISKFRQFGSHQHSNNIQPLDAHSPHSVEDQESRNCLKGKEAQPVNQQTNSFNSKFHQCGSHQHSSNAQPLDTDSSQSVEDQESRNCVKGKEANPSDEKMRNAADDIASDCDSATIDQSDLMNFDHGESHVAMDSQQTEQGSYSENSRGKEVDVISDSVHDVEHPHNTIRENEAEKVGVTESQDIGQEFTENCKNNEDDDTVLNFSADIVEDEEDAEKLLLSEAEHTCVINDQEKDIEMSGDTVSSNQEEQYDVCKSSLLHDPSLCLQTPLGDSSSSESESNTGVTSSVDAPVKAVDCLPSAHTCSNSAFPKSKANTDVATSVDSSSSNCTGTGNAEGHLGAYVTHNDNDAKTAVRDVNMSVGDQCSVLPIHEQNGIGSDEESLGAFESDSQSHEVISNQIVGQLQNRTVH